MSMSKFLLLTLGAALFTSSAFAEKLIIQMPNTGLYLVKPNEDGTHLEGKSLDGLKRRIRIPINSNGYKVISSTDLPGDPGVSEESDNG